MNARLQPIVTFGQELILSGMQLNMQSMVAISRDEEKLRFSRRLVAACDSCQACPKERGRMQWLAKKLSQSPQAVRKWFNSESIPDQTNITRLANLLNVHAGWLQQGPGEQVVKANIDDTLSQLQYYWPDLSDTVKNQILGFAAISATPLPDKDDEPKPVLKLPPPSTPVTE